MIVIILTCIIILFILLKPKYQEPHVIRNVFSAEVCDHIISISKSKLHPSTIDTNRVVNNDTRKSETAWLDPRRSRTIERVIDKCVSFTDRKPVNCEKLQVLRYKPGGFYKPHQDAFPLTSQPNPRMYTCIIALNDEYIGGETVFPNLDKSFKLNKGDVLLFNTLNDWGYHTDKALHGGAPVESGEKWICNLWIHKHPYEFND